MKKTILVNIVFLLLTLSVVMIGHGFVFAAGDQDIGLLTKNLL